MWMRVLLPAVVLALTAGCGGASTPVARPGVFLPPGQGPAPIVLLVPGGSWTSADPTGLVPLAKALARNGVVAVTSTYRVHPAARFPAPVEDVLCAAAKAVADARAAGHGGGRLVLVGHSAGGPLVMLAALRRSSSALRARHRPSCPTPSWVSRAPTTCPRCSRSH